VTVSGTISNCVAVSVVRRRALLVLSETENILQFCMRTFNAEINLYYT